ncbi:hemolysin family protein [Radicibacter daui]|uniref:hemolysin family protein n=1 Tax=Radicibacter daui TaxID=3064829 RepID=UPI004046AA0D
MFLTSLAVVLVLVLLNGVFAMSEMAVVSARRARLGAAAKQGNKGAEAALALADEPTRFLSAVQTGITLIGILAGAYGEASLSGELDGLLAGVPLIAPYARPLSTALVVILITYLSLVVGELVPKRLALLYPEAIAARVARPLSLMARIMAPAVHLLALSTGGVLRLLGLGNGRRQEMTQEEVETVIAEGTSAGLIEPAEREMMSGIMRLGDRPVRVAMTPRHEVSWISLADEDSQLRAEIAGCPYSRMVVVRNDDLDTPLGVLHKKSVLEALLADPQKAQQPLALETLVEVPLFIPETASVLSTLELFKKTTVHMAFVVDEFGTFLGVVTTADLLEMIAGDFPEAHDTVEPGIVPQEDGSFLIEGSSDIEDVSRRIGHRFAEARGFHTAAGLVLDRLGRLPQPGTELMVEGWRITVLEMEGRRISRLRLLRAER